MIVTIDAPSYKTAMFLLKTSFLFAMFTWWLTRGLMRTSDYLQDITERYSKFTSKLAGYDTNPTE